MKKTLMLLQTDFPPDVRVENEIFSLVQAGYLVHLLCTNHSGKDSKTIDNKLTIHRIGSKNYSSKARRFLAFPMFINPIWYIKIFGLIKAEKISIIHVHDLPLLPIAIIFKYFLGIKVIYDMHENYPAALKVWKKQGFEYWIKHPGIAKFLEKQFLPKSDGLIAVIEENKHRIENEYSLKKSKSIIVSNTVNMALFTPDYPIDTIPFPANKIKFLYTGGIDSHRGINTLIESFLNLLKTNQDIYLILVGKGRESRKIKDMIHKKKLDEKIYISDYWVDLKHIPYIISRSDICVIPQEKNIHTDTTIPHKLFQYMLFSKPVLAADALPMVRILNETNAGLSFISGNSQDLTDQMIRLIQDKSLRKHLGRNGNTSIINKYNWEKDASELLSLYNELEPNL